jgi:hypothetical protein
MHISRLRLTVRDLLIGIMLVAASLGSYLAGRKEGYAEGTRRPPNYAKDRAQSFTRWQTVASAGHLYAIYNGAKQLEADDPGFLARKPGVSAVPSKGDVYSARQFTVTFTDPKSKKSLSVITQIDESLIAEYETGSAP